ncbi:uncharacterized protein PG986_005194 [Apiospora aurea]|uniref:Stc1 domain-containing protein n=1 Tax=Apiospora aurea TaxID=335848 RepID=A0ABR1QGV1_9PEZI
MAPGKGRKCFTCLETPIEEGKRKCDGCKFDTMKRLASRIKEGSTMKTREDQDSIGERCGERSTAGPHTRSCVAHEAARQNETTDAKVVRKRQQNARRYSSLKLRGLCTACGIEPAGEGGLICKDCRAKKTSYTQKRRGQARDNLVCVRCISRLRKAGCVHCETCLEVLKGFNRKCRNKGKHKADAQKPEQQPVLDDEQENDDDEEEEEEAKPDLVRESVEQDLMETDPGDNELVVDDIVTIHGFDRMAIDYIMN